MQILLTEFHGSKIGGHSGVLKTFKWLSSEFFWYGMKWDVISFVAACPVCQQNKASTLSPGGLLQPLPLLNQVWDDISVDFVEGLPKSAGNNSILVVVDQLSKYTHFLALCHPFYAKSVAALFVKEVVRLHGFPRTIVSDHNKIFLSHFWKELFKLQGTSLHHSTAYHPQSEVVNRCLEAYLRCFVSGKPAHWFSHLAWAEYWYNTSFHVSAGMTPFRALYGRDPPKLLRFESGSTANSLLE